MIGGFKLLGLILHFFYRLIKEAFQRLYQHLHHLVQLKRLEATVDTHHLVSEDYNLFHTKSKLSNGRL